MVLHNHFLISILEQLDFIISVLFVVFLFWTIIGVWKVLEDTFETNKALLIFAALSLMLVAVSYI